METQLENETPPIPSIKCSLWVCPYFEETTWGVASPVLGTISLKQERWAGNA